jgi:hypothetical protein
LQENRKNPRKAIQRTVRAVSVQDTNPSANCLLLDISQSGARLHTSDAAKLPDVFLLVLAEGVQKWCRVARRNGNEVGVRFIKSQRALPGQRENRKRPRHQVKRAVQAVSVNDSRLAVDCTLIDVSQSGGRLRSENAGSIPGEFVLVLRDDLHKWCRVVRRSKNEVGVKFIKLPPDSARA